MKNILNKHKSIIVLNGRLPEKKLFRGINIQVPIVAADGAVDTMRKLGFESTYVVGDGDSVKKHSCATMIKIEDQDSTDFEKCMLFIQKNALFPTLVLGMSGGEIDHTMGNMQAFVKRAYGVAPYFLDTYTRTGTKKLGVKIGIPLIERRLDLELEAKSLISVLPFGTTRIKSKGLCWELGDFALTYNSILGIRNVNIKNNVSFELHEGRALLIVDISDYFS